jgi:hypothetical protein
LLAVVAGGLGIASGCGPEVVETRTVMVEKRVEPPSPPVTDILITDLREIPAASPAEEKVLGRIINRGDKPVSQLSIRVDALDDRGRVIETITTPPLDQTIAALGGEATFEATIPRNPLITTYHAVAVAR